MKQTGKSNAQNLLKRSHVVMGGILVFLLTNFVTSSALGKEKTTRKVQEVSFEEMDLKGTVRNPDGAYLVQKRGIKFMPLMDVKKNMDAKIRESVQYVR